MVGQKYENQGIAKDGAKMVTAVACASVPKFTVVIGGSFGAGNYAMCGRAYGARMLWTWPNARISVMGGEQAAHVLATVRDDGMQSRGESWPEAEKAAFMEDIRSTYEDEGHTLFRLGPVVGLTVLSILVDTRKILGLAMFCATRKPQQPQSEFGIFRM